MSRVVIVSNRLPISVKKIDGKLKFYPSAGGLATGLSSYTKEKNNQWVGWPGLVSDDLTDNDAQTISKELKKHNCYPVFITQKQIDSYYNGYSNSVLWPLFHDMPATHADQKKDWVTYRQVNQLFAQTALGVSSPESTVWVHDYQLLMVPEFLRAERPYEVVGFFLHIPFPSLKSIAKLPQAKTLISTMLDSDLVGFHTDSYVDNFLDACRELDVGKVVDGEVKVGKRSVSATAFPLGIDYSKFSKAGTSDKVLDLVKALRKKYGRRKKIILTVDRLDPTKGLVERLVAYQELLRANRRLRKKVVLVMLAIPSRTEIKAYKQLKQKIEKLVKEINQTYGKRRWQPVHYMYKTVPFEELAALYRVADIAFIAPKKDGMNLVAKEYIASRADKRGVLILSETAGAANELSDALLVNPNRPNSLVSGLTDALNMTPKELQKRVQDMRRQLASNTVHHWKRAFMDELQPSNTDFMQQTKQLANGTLNRMLEDFQKAKNPTLLLDYDGVLAGFSDNPDNAKPSQRIKKVLRELSKVTKGEVMIVSGRNRHDLDKWLGDLGAALAAEHGARFRPKDSKTWKKIVDTHSNWQELILPVLQKYADKTPGAFVERKEAALVWHHRAASPYHAQKNLTILRRILKPLLGSLGLTMYRGNMILEIKSPDANKGAAARYWLREKHDFVLAFGDDYTDEDMFAALPDSAYTVKVGRGKTLARYRVNSTNDVYEVLAKLAKVKK